MAQDELGVPGSLQTESRKPLVVAHSVEDWLRQFGDSATRTGNASSANLHGSKPGGSLE